LSSSRLTEGKFRELDQALDQLTENKDDILLMDRFETVCSEVEQALEDVTEKSGLSVEKEGHEMLLDNKKGENKMGKEVEAGCDTETVSEVKMARIAEMSGEGKTTKLESAREAETVTETSCNLERPREGKTAREMELARIVETARQEGPREGETEREIISEVERVSEAAEKVGDEGIIAMEAETVREAKMATERKAGKQEEMAEESEAASRKG
jgi:hypothetical protein